MNISQTFFCCWPTISAFVAVQSRECAMSLEEIALYGFIASAILLVCYYLTYLFMMTMWDLYPGWSELTFWQKQRVSWLTDDIHITSQDENNFNEEYAKAYNNGKLIGRLGLDTTFRYFFLTKDGKVLQLVRFYFDF